MTSASFTNLGTIFTATTAVVARGVMGTAMAILRFPANLKAAVQAWRNRSHVLSMTEMDDRMLSDIGLTRSDVASALASPLTTDPTTRLRIIAVERRAGNRAQARERRAEAKVIQLASLQAAEVELK
jgi:uncharacterized protein YjiS (DUF1127 family)